MSSKSPDLRGRLAAVFRRLSVRLSFFSTVIVAATSLLLFVVAYFLLSTSLAAQNREAIRLRLLETWARYQTGGIDLIQEELLVEERLGAEELVFVRISDPDGRDLLTHVPEQWTHFDYRALEDKSDTVEGKRLLISSAQEDYNLEVGSVSLPDGNLLQVGLSTREREGVLSRFREMFLIVLLPLLTLSTLSGLTLTVNALRPIHNIIGTIRRIIDTRKMDDRIPVRGTGDELDQLVSLFNAMLERIDRLIAGMREALDHVGHDMKTPLTRLRGAAELAIRSDAGEDELREALGGCIEETDHLLSMLEILTDISEAETGIMRLHLENTDLSELVRSVIDIYDYIAEEKGMALRLHAPSSFSAVVDPVRIKQAVANLIDNAIKYSPEGGMVNVKIGGRGSEAVVSVSDVGIGIQPSETRHIWNRLYRSDRSRSTPGQGLGLSLVKAIALAHGGSVHVESEPGKGSCFSLSIPLERPSDRKPDGEKTPV